jgi:hypothetical protein
MPRSEMLRLVRNVRQPKEFLEVLSGHEEKVDVALFIASGLGRNADAAAPGFRRK